MKKIVFLLLLSCAQLSADHDEQVQERQNSVGSIAQLPKGEVIESFNEIAHVIQSSLERGLSKKEIKILLEQVYGVEVTELLDDWEDIKSNKNIKIYVGMVTAVTGISVLAFLCGAGAILYYIATLSRRLPM